MFVIGSGLLYLVYNFDPNGKSLLPPCIFHELTGLHCPGCGGTRAVNSLLHGNFLAALGYNPLLIAVLPFLLIAMADEVQCIFTNKRKLSFNIPPKVGWGILILIIIFTVLRNLPWYPFTILAP